MAVTSAQVQAAVASAVSAVQGVQAFTTASRATINDVLAQVTAAQTLVSTAISEADAAIIGTASGSVAGVATAGTGAGPVLLAQVDVVQRLPQLSAIQALLGRMAKNLVSDGSAGTQVVLAGRSLYDIALASYGDENAWPDIAAANGLTDPELIGINTVIVPPAQTGTDGVLQP